MIALCSPKRHGRAVILLLAAALGCQSPIVRTHPAPNPAPKSKIARELEMVTLPEYTVAAPDILLIDAVRLVPRAPYKIEPLDLLAISVAGALPDQPIESEFQVQPDGTVALGPSYGSVKVVDLTTDEAAAAIRRSLATIVNEPEVSVSLYQAFGLQQIEGDKIIMPDGTVSLGSYGSVYVSGLTIPQIKQVVEKHLEAFLERPLMSIDILAYNSKVYYIILEGAGNGDQVLRLPITGNEHVLDALGLAQGLTRFSSKHVWIARPTPSGQGCDQILPVDYTAIVQGASTDTNYQIMPGDRVFVAEDKLIALDAAVARFTAPFERVFGVSLLGVQTVQTINRLPFGFQNSFF
jgi:protein involved in polysaccharide export with SLBB domain